MSYSTVTNYNAGDTISATALNGLFSDIETLISGSAITGDNFSPRARIPNTALDMTTQLIPICFHIGKAQYAVPVYASAVRPVALIPFHIVNPTNATGTTYTLSNASYFITDDGGGTLAATIMWGFYEAGTFVTDQATIANSFVLNKGAGSEEGATTTLNLTTASILMTERPRCFALFLTVLDATALSATIASASITLHVQVDTRVL